MIDPPKTSTATRTVTSKTTTAHSTMLVVVSRGCVGNVSVVGGSWLLCIELPLQRGSDGFICTKQFGSKVTKLMSLVKFAPPLIHLVYKVNYIVVEE